jgi:hypothetical protein
MRAIFRIPALADEVWILRAGSHLAPEDAEHFAPAQAAWHLDDWLPREAGRSRAVLADLCAELGAPFVARPELDAAELRAWVQGALREGVLRAYRIVPKLSGAGVVEVSEPPPSEPPPPVEEKTWIAIVLTDEDKRPVPFRRYRIELPDASIREGILDENGRARIAGIDPGSCKVSFPDFHAKDWKKAG